MARFAASRTLLAPVGDVWAFIAEPYHLSDWWPGVSGVEPDRRGVAAGARWRVIGPGQPGLLRKPRSEGMLLVQAAAPKEHFRFELTQDRLTVDLRLEPTADNRTEATIAVEGRFVGGPRRNLPKIALRRLYDLIQTGASL